MKKLHVINPEMMLEIFQEVISIFNSLALNYWVDSGTLLGIIRENSFMPWENDIDIALWKEDIDNKIRTDVYKIMFLKGYEVKFKRSKVTFKKNGIKVDIWFLDKTGDYATRIRIIPTSAFSKILFKYAEPFGGLSSKMAQYKYRLLCWLMQIFGCSKVTIKIPRKYLQRITKYDFKGIDIRIPKDVEEYLAFRYGRDWRIPDKNWDTLTQDGAFK